MEYTTPNQYNSAKADVVADADNLFPPRHLLNPKYSREFDKAPFLAEKYDQFRVMWIDAKVVLRLEPNAPEVTFASLMGTADHAENEMAQILVAFENGRDAARLLRENKKPGILEKVRPQLMERIKQEKDLKKYQKAVAEHKKKDKTGGGYKPDAPTKSKKCRHCGFTNPNHSPADCKANKDSSKYDASFKPKWKRN